MVRKYFFEILVVLIVTLTSVPAYSCGSKQPNFEECPRVERFEEWERLSKDLMAVNTSIPWGPTNFTDPNHHDSKSYKYIVHAVDSNLISRSNKDPKQVMNFLKERIFSASVVQANHNTFAFARRCALILKVPMGHIAAARDSDLYTDMGKIDSRKVEQLRHNMEIVNELPDGSGLWPPEKTIPEDKNAWNEVAIVGHNPVTNTDVEVIGIAKQNCKSRPDVNQFLDKVAKKYNLPTVELNQ